MRMGGEEVEGDRQKRRVRLADYGVCGGVVQNPRNNT